MYQLGIWPRYDAQHRGDPGVAQLGQVPGSAREAWQESLRELEDQLERVVPEQEEWEPKNRTSLAG